jgi:predicted GIY-YIG superfamily endonuclease
VSRPLEGVIYLIHLDGKLAHSRHYIGWAHTGRLDARLEHHARGTGSRFMAAVREAGIGWHVARTWTGDRYLERRLKNRHGAGRFCPECKKEVA